MKISWNWLKEILPVKIDINEAAQLLTDIGLEVESINRFETILGSLAGLIVGEVQEVEKHPDADKLKITKVNIGANTILTIVCGAPNVAAGQKVIVALEGTTIYPTKSNPISIKKAKIRGVESNGMLCAEDEIGLSDNHAGLYILPDDAVVGSEVKKYFPVYEDTTIEIGLTANHADANSHYGVARELCAVLTCREIENTAIIHPVNYAITSKLTSPIQVVIENEEACRRYSGISIKNIQIKESPQWLQNKLKAIGMRPINAIVDITNYVMHYIGQPLHAFDLDKLKGDTLFIKNVADNTLFTTLDEKERKLHHDDLMICDAGGPICLAGVYGGLHSGISDTTQAVFLESAFFTGAGIRKTEARHGLKTDASTRFGKGTDADMTIIALQQAAHLIIELCGGEISSPILDIYPEKIKPFFVFLRYARLEMIGAITIPKAKIIEILEALGIKIIQEKHEGIELEVPPYKNDVTREIDIIEELLRIYGYNKIPIPTSIKTPFSVIEKPDREKIKSDTLRYISAQGYYEIFTNSISKSKYTEKWMPAKVEEQVKLLNSLNTELDCMRQTLVFSGLEVIAFNHNRKQTDLRLFETGNTFNHINTAFVEEEKLALFITGNKQEENWQEKKEQVDFFYLKRIVNLILSKMFLKNYSVQPDENSAVLSTANTLLFKNKIIGTYGQIKEEICNDFTIKMPVFFAELNWADLVNAYASEKVEFKEKSKFPEVRRDLSLIIEKNIPYQSVESIAKKEGKSLLRDIVLFDIYEGEKLLGKKSYAIGLIFRDEEKTLTDKEIDTIMTSMMQRYESELNAVIRKE